MSPYRLIPCLLFAPCICSVQWCYQSQYLCKSECRDPTQWFLDFPVCGGQKQSPINIVTQRAQLDLNLTQIVFEGYTQELNITVDNLGYAAVFSLPSSVRIRGGGLPATYKAVQFHLHWGLNGGSEHTVDGEQYPMELHIVHIKEQYQTLMEAMNDTKGVAALGIFFEVSQKENQKLNKLIEALGRVPYSGNSSVIQGFRLADMMRPMDNLSSYYRYSGSLTTPRCDEAIIWTVFQQTTTISQKQLENITKQMFFDNGLPMTDNFRPLQKLNSRVVYKSTERVLSHCDSVLSVPLILLICMLWGFGLTE